MTMKKRSRTLIGPNIDTGNLKNMAAVRNVAFLTLAGWSTIRAIRADIPGSRYKVYPQQVASVNRHL